MFTTNNSTSSYSCKEIASILNVSPPINCNNSICSSVTADSRKVTSGTIFVAIAGYKVDGHNFIHQAIEQGAVLLVVSKKIQEIVSIVSIPIISVSDTRHALGVLAAALADNPSNSLELIGITGTNGKTTTSFFISSVLQSAGIPAGLIGTTGYFDKGLLHPLSQTTPDSETIQKLLTNYLKQSMKACVMEVSSHSIVQKRISGCRFKAGIFTNITNREHLDYHKSFDAYLAAKQDFFKNFIANEEDAFACINLDDTSATLFEQAAGSNVLLYSRKGDKRASIRASKIESGLFGVSFEIFLYGISYPVTIPIPGIYNVDNALAAASVGVGFGIAPKQIIAGLQNVPQIPGRFELVDEKQNFAVIVDYAHTDDALHNLLEGARACNPNKLITVFGCGGDRDHSKRPLMGKIAAELSDLVFVTSDNPRTEDPIDIINDIIKGIANNFSDKITIEPNRKDAIKQAISLAQKDDMVVIAGKGHENYQILATQTIRFDDREEVRKILNAKE